MKKVLSGEIMFCLTWMIDQCVSPDKNRLSP